ncbi:MAG TPA: LD-carboxypeptidase [Ignavibacteriales bacterium]|nr:LD-carboxypeptidase [Ignavibacteriales bacterium]HOL80973.1 LD-carboxypeptidase [Ignavibacteriales bacterium]HOM64708.1 LD-carboxypeptidase [Ignavibacteriales bacterium]HPD66760.1 LD-carboxypeptidase [Ignavibacteriales bacterium]HPP32753.1 LD-carboxypeptidase [Ignavibacteriales bacterium]
MLIKPNPLKKNDVIGLITPASTPADLSRIEKSVRYFEKIGYRVVVGKNVGKKYYYLAGTDEERVEDIHSMFENKNIKAIFCLRGGYGTVRLLNKIDYNLIKKNPKIFVGYSDITALQMAFLTQANLVTFSGPMPAVDFYDNVSSYTEEIFWDLVTNIHNKYEYKFKNNIVSITKSSARGIAIGGNFIVFNSLIGTKYFPSLHKKILFLEEVEEKPYKIDRMLAHLKLNKEYNKIKGFVFGQFEDCTDNNPEENIEIENLLRQYLKDETIPVLYNINFGHIKDFITIPFGIRVSINSSNKTIKLLESCLNGD